MASVFRRTFFALGCSSAALLYVSLDSDKLDRKKILVKAKACCAAPTETESTFSQNSWDWNWDKRTTKNKAAIPKLQRIKKHYIFVRHGEYNTKGYDDEERYLTPLGQEQADLTGKWLKSLDIDYTKIVQSNMTRAIETRTIISKYLPKVKVETSDLLREGAPIPPDPPIRDYEPELKYFSDAPRIESAFRNFVHRPNRSDKDESVEVYVCHANVIRYFLCRVLQFPPQAWLRMSLRHGSITWITVYSDGDVFVRSIGDTGYMPPSKLSR